MAKIEPRVKIQVGGCYTDRKGATWMCILKMPFKEQERNCVMVRLDNELLRITRENGLVYEYSEDDDDLINLALHEPDLEVIARNQILVKEHYERKERLKRIQESLHVLNEDINPPIIQDTPGTPMAAIKKKSRGFWDKLFRRA